MEQRLSKASHLQSDREKEGARFQFTLPNLPIGLSHTHPYLRIRKGEVLGGGGD